MSMYMSHIRTRNKWVTYAYSCLHTYAYAYVCVQLYAYVTHVKVKVLRLRTIVSICNMWTKLCGAFV